MVVQPGRLGPVAGPPPQFVRILAVRLVGRDAHALLGVGGGGLLLLVGHVVFYDDGRGDV